MIRKNTTKFKCWYQSKKTHKFFTICNHETWSNNQDLKRSFWPSFMNVEQILEIFYLCPIFEPGAFFSVHTLHAWMGVILSQDSIPENTATFCTKQDDLGSFKWHNLHPTHQGAAIITWYLNWRSEKKFLDFSVQNYWKLNR